MRITRRGLGIGSTVHIGGTNDCKYIEYIESISEFGVPVIWSCDGSSGEVKFKS